MKVRNMHDILQDFISMPWTLSTMICYPGGDILPGRTIYAERDISDKRKEKEMFFKGKKRCNTNRESRLKRKSG